MKLFNLILCFFITTICFCQKQNKEAFLSPLIVEEINEFYVLDGHYSYYIDKSRSLSFDDIVNKTFITGELAVDFQSTYWLKFQVKPNIKANYLLILPNVSDRAIIYAPQKETNDYRAIRLGILVNNNPIKIDVAEASIANINYESIDFSRPFYVKKEIVTDWGEINLEYPMAVSLTSNENFIENYMKENSHAPKFQIYSIILFVSFIFFLVNFIVSKDKNYLNYSLYLLSTALLFSVRLPSVFNLINTVEPRLFYYVRIFGVTSASGFYFYFVVYFLNFKHRFPRLYKLSLITLNAILIFTVSYLLLIVIFPYLPYKVLVMIIFKIIFTLISLWVFIFLLFQKGDTIYKAVLVSSLLLIIGNLLSTITDWSFFFLNTVLIEIIIFTAIVSYTNKINSKKRLENKFLLEQEQINNQNLLEINQLKSNFFANISHEFRTPLTLISSPIDDELAKDSISDKKRQQFTVAKQNSERLLELINQLLDLSKIDAGHLKLQLQKGNVLQLISALSDSFSYHAKQKHIIYVINIEQDEETVWFDKDAIEKITVNLLSNAIKYTGEGGTVTCKAYVENKNLCIEVKNTGKGLTAHELKNIFERFYQTNEQNQGSGIGLALVRELVELHKGTIEVSSIPNEETLFKLSLCIDKNNFKKESIVAEASTDKVQPEIPLFTSSTIEDEEKFTSGNLPILLIVEDNDDLRHLLKQTFEDRFHVISASNGTIGVEQALEHIPDLIISDIMMPEKDGITLTKELKNDERSAHIPIILLTAKAEVESQFKGIETGADDYITKPFNKNLLVLKVEKLIESRRQLQLRYSQELVLLPKDIAVTNLDEKFLKKVETILEKNLIDPSFNVTEFSEAIGMSRMQLHRKLKALTGLTASEFIRSQRLKLAAQILKSSDINMSEVGYSVGFNDHSYFTKCFKEAYNCTPTEFANRS
ncbi:response regulator [Winogradskyella helgolandensis]|uniref:response regulator n=1 Tax=Winogradskyella helgolandensis TaxID=2697010 RepID=UPI0015C16DEC|nr:response regulator [Winogradskyella helgolandensis]